jgi:small-conductance mechanosensitive channel
VTSWIKSQQKSSPFFGSTANWLESFYDDYLQAKPTVLFKDFADSALIFEIRFFISNIQEIFPISSQVRFDIWEVFKEAGVEISFPQRDLHIRTAPGLEGVFDGK